MTPEPAPTIRQLLAFYLEAGVDCALTDEPVNRLSDPAASPRSGRVSEPPPPEPARGAASRSGSARRGHTGAGGRDRLGAGSGANRAVAGSAAALLEHSTAAR